LGRGLKGPSAPEAPGFFGSRLPRKRQEADKEAALQKVELRGASKNTASGGLLPQLHFLHVALLNTHAKSGVARSKQKHCFFGGFYLRSHGLQIPSPYYATDPFVCLLMSLMSKSLLSGVSPPHPPASGMPSDACCLEHSDASDRASPHPPAAGVSPPHQPASGVSSLVEAS